jgi:hypothetical protein
MDEAPVLVSAQRAICVLSISMEESTAGNFTPEATHLSSAATHASVC